MTMTPVRPLFGRVVASLLIVSAALVSQGCPSPAVSIYRLAEADRPGRRRALAQLAAEGHRLHRNRAATWYTALFDGRSSAIERQLRVARRPLPTDGELDWIELLLERQRGRRYPIESLWRRVASPGPYQDLAFRLLARRLRETTPYTRDDPGVAASRVLLERLRRLRPTRAWSPLAVDQRLRSIAWLQRRIRGRVDHPRRPLRLRVDRRPQSALRLRDLDLRWFSVGRREDLVAREIPGGRLHFGRSGVYRLELVRPRGIGAAWLRIETPFPLRIRHRSQETAIDPSRDGPLRFLELDRGPDDAPIRIVVGASNEPRPLILRWIAIPNEAADRRKRGRHRSHSSPPGIGFRVVSDTPALVQRRPRCGGDDDSRRLWLDGWRALVLGRNHDAQRCLHTLSLRLPSNPGVLAMLAEALLGDTSYPRSRREQSAVSLLENALQRDGAAMRAAMLLSRLADRRGLDERALRRLDALPKRERQRAPIVLARVAMLSEKGRVVEARAALERALQRFPHDCRIAVAIVRLWREQRDVLPMSTWVVAGTRLKRWLGATTTCRTLETELARSDEQSGHDERAIERYRRLLTVDPGDDATRLQLARLLLRTGQRQPAERELRRLARSRPRLELVHWLLAASRLGRGGTPHRRRERLDLLRRFAFLGAPLFPGIAIDDGRRLLARFLADRAAVARTNDRGAVIILRRRVSRLLGSGDEIRLDHVVVRVQDRSSLEQLGELHVPAGAELWRVRTLKANGRVLEIENSDDKEAISLPGLAIGDAIEYAYITFSRQTPRLFGEVDGERFYLQHQSLPTVEARYDLIVDDPAMAKRLRWDVRGPGREPQRHQTHGVRHFSWRATDLAPLDPEPDAPPTDDELRQVRVTTLTQIDALRRQLEDWLAERLTSNRDLESAIEPIARLHTPLARLHAALRLVQRRLKTNVRELGQRNTAHDFITRRGNRALLLKLLLDRLSIPNVLALVRPFSRLMQPAELPDPSVFEHPVLRVRLGTRTIWLDPAWIGAPLGYLMPGLQGRPALLLSPFPRSPLDGSKTPTLAQTPRGSIDDEGRTIVAAGHLESSGQLALQVEERLRGRVAVSYRRFLLSRGHEQRRKAIERVLRVWFPEAKLRKLEILDLQRNEKPLRLRYHASGRLAPSISLGFAGLYEIEELSRVARRRQALLIENPRHVDLTIRLAVEPQLVVRHPTVQTIVGPGLRFQIADELTEGKGITIRRRFVLRSGRLAPARYPELLRGLRRIIGIETISFERRR